jgi:hypothetical protein
MPIVTLTGTAKNPARRSRNQIQTTEAMAAKRRKMRKKPTRPFLRFLCLFAAKLP